MDILNSIKEKTIIICEDNYKKNILKKMSENHLFLNVKFYTKKNFLEELFFKYDEKTIYYLVSKYNLKVEIAKMYLKNLIYIDSNIMYENPKLNFLNKLKKELEENKLFIYNSNFKNFIGDYTILVVGYPYIEPFEKNIFDSLNVIFLEEDSNNTIKNVYEFNTQEEEVNFVFKSICKLITEGIDINKIKIVGINEDYYTDLERLSSFYNIPIKIPSNNNLYSHTISQKFLSNIKNSIEEGLRAIKDDNEELVNKITSICNKYIFDGNLDIVLKLIVNDLKNTKIDNFNYQNYIEIKDINSLFDNEYVFFMNFNNGSNPTPLKDEEYITDNIKDNLGLFKTNILNKYNKNYLIKKLKSIKDLTITYKLKNQNGESYPSALIKDLNLNVKKYIDNIYNSYSYTNDLINYVKDLDDYELYGEISQNLNVYKSSFENIHYKSYDNSFKGIFVPSLHEYLHNHLTLSYTSLSNYNKCAFRYYLANILKLDKYEESFEAFIGSLFHDVLEKCFTHNLIVEDEIREYINKTGKILTIKERFFVNKICNDIEFVISTLNRQKKYINLDKAYYEKNIKIDKSTSIQVEFTGFIDKILYKEENNETKVAIIDYKTGFIDIDLKYLPYGLSLQLPIYLYLVKKSNLFKNPRFIGFYLQYILDKDITRDKNLSYEEQKYANLKLMGYSNSEEHILKCFDSSYQNSDLIKGMKTNTNGDFSNYAKVLNDKEIDKIIDLTEENIDNSINKIVNAEFPINPKRIGYDKVLGCLYCRFQDICFHKDEDYVTLDEIENLDFLGENKYDKVD